MKNILFKTLVICSYLAITSAQLLAVEFDRDVRPIINQACISCHGSKKPKADLDYTTYPDEDAFRADADLLENMLFSLEENEMPPRKAKRQITQEERELMIHWVEATLNDLRNANPNDPGLVVVPRVNHHQYNYIARDLSGHDINVAALLPMDGGSGEGFANVGESHGAGVAQVEKFLTAAKFLAQHLRMSPKHGIRWANKPKPGLKDDAKLLDEIKADWVNLWSSHHMKSINGWSYGRLGKYGTYAEAAFKFKRASSTDEAAHEIAASYPYTVVPGIIRNWVHFLESNEVIENPYCTEIVKEWRALPADISDEDLREFAKRFQKTLYSYAARMPYIHHRTDQPGVSHGKTGSDRKIKYDDLTKRARYPMWIDRNKLVGNGEVFDLVISPAGDGHEGDIVNITEFMEDSDRNKKKAKTWSHQAKAIKGKILKQEAGLIQVQAPAVIRLNVSSKQKWYFMAVQLDKDLGKDGTVQVKLCKPKDVPQDITELDQQYVLGFPDSEKTKALWQPAAQLQDVHYQGSQYIVGTYMFHGFEGLDPKGLTKRMPKDDILEVPLWRPMYMTHKDIYEFMGEKEYSKYKEFASEIIALRKSLPEDMDKRVVGKIIKLAEQAWRGAVSSDLKQRLTNFYTDLRKNGHSIDASIKRTATIIFVHPKFLYRLQHSKQQAESYELSGSELASRLSFALWGSIPDDDLKKAAADGSLKNKGELFKHAQRMLADERAHILLTDFAGYWLHYEGFEHFDAIDSARYKKWNSKLRDAMYQEIKLFMKDIIIDSKPITNVLYAPYTYVNKDLAALYGIKGVNSDEMQRVELGDNKQRGGLITMAGILAKTSKPLRTSPVVRGDWVLQEILGQSMPPPPDNVPLLSDDEVDKDGLTFLQQLAKHREDPACFSCHAKLDPIGIAMENYSPIGQWRSKSHKGNALVTRDIMPDGSELDGIDGLRAYLEKNKVFFTRHFCKKLLGYCLGRKVLVTDKPVIDAMQSALEKEDYQFTAALRVVLDSQQFRQRRDEIVE